MILSLSQMKEVEEVAFKVGAQPFDLMEEAGRGIAEVIQQFFAKPGRCLLYCGKGNNAGDILVAGRLLAKIGWKIFIRTAFPRQDMNELALLQLETLREENLFFDEEYFHCRTKEPFILLDGLLGIGAQGEPHGRVRELIEEINARRINEGAFVVAADLPSGLDATTGTPSTSCVQADLTVAIGYCKKGLVEDVATNHVGRLAIVPLTSLKAKAGDPSVVMTSASLRGLLPPRSFNVHKGTFGRVGIIAGSRGYLGAARLASAASAHAGAGLVTLYALPENYKVLASSVLPEVMVKQIGCYTEVLSKKLDALAIGPGLGSQHHSEILEIIEKAAIPCVLDADALNALASEMSRLLSVQGPRLLTPHPGEMERLFSQQGRTRMAWATEFVEKYPVALLLKGARTIVAEREKAIAYNTTGNPGMASGGMGDVLTGVATAFLAAGHQPYQAAMLGAWLCGHAAELTVFEGTASSESLLATNIIYHLGAAIKNLRAGAF